ncbi:MAG: hypothetical protein WC376_01440 [Candidatus Nanoarchaeia archaeon]|jgi:hypothetical protein
MILGFSTGSLYKHLEPLSNEAVDAISSTGCNAIELCALFNYRIELLNILDINKLKKFNYVSLHSSEELRYANNVETRKLLNTIVKYNKIFKFDNIIIHSDIVDDWNIFKDYDLPFLFENIGRKDGFGYKLDEIIKIIENNHKLVLDLTHDYIVDKNMNLSNNLLKNYNNSIKEIHVSGYKKHGKDEQQHYPIYITQQKEMISHLVPNIPTIIESVIPFENKDYISELQKEYSFLKSLIKKSSQ